jgi:hypothetical protein
MDPKPRPSHLGLDNRTVGRNGLSQIRRLIGAYPPRDPLASKRPLWSAKHRQCSRAQGRLPRDSVGSVRNSHPSIKRVPGVKPPLSRSSALPQYAEPGVNDASFGSGGIS